MRRFFRALLDSNLSLLEVQRFHSTLPRTLRHALVAGLVRLQHLEALALRTVEVVANLTHPVIHQCSPLPPYKYVSPHGNPGNE